MIPRIIKYIEKVEQWLSGGYSSLLMGRVSTWDNEKVLEMVMDYSDIVQQCGGT